MYHVFLRGGRLMRDSCSTVVIFSGLFAVNQRARLQTDGRAVNQLV
ncbi:hypothetical protein [Spirochaeta dissipatitropha]